MFFPVPFEPCWNYKVEILGAYFFAAIIPLVLSVSLISDISLLTSWLSSGIYLHNLNN